MTGAEIPYGAYWSTPFAKWGGALVPYHSVRLAAFTAKRAMERRGIDPGRIDHGVLGMTVPQQNSFYGLPWLMGMAGAKDVAGPTISQACATGARILCHAASEVALGRARCVLAVSADRTSNGPTMLYPDPSAPGGSPAHERWVLDNFSSDPFARCAMVDTAENVAARDGIDLAEQHAVTLRRFEQYSAALADDRAFQRRYMDLPFALPDRKWEEEAGALEGDEGIYPTTADKLAKLKPVREGGTVTFGAQTHPADGNAAVIVTDADTAREVSRRPEIRVRIAAFGEAREAPGYMPAAPIAAARKALDAAGLSIGEIDAIKSHNPFAVNDIAFARAFQIPWERMNNYGSSLIWGHPQGPTGLRAIIELVEELAVRGGGTGLFQGCAAGDSAMACVVVVEDRG